MCIKKVLAARRLRKKGKADVAEYEKMLNSVQEMCGIALSKEEITNYIRKATEEEVQELIRISESVPPDNPRPGQYYIPSLSMFVSHCLKKWPDRVFHLRRLGTDARIDSLEKRSFLFYHVLPSELLNKDLFVFYYDNFGFPGTNLCARAGYVIYDPENKDIVACRWNWIS